MPVKSAASITKFKKLEIESLFNNIKFRFKEMGLEILLAPRSLDYSRVLISVSRRYGNAPQRNLFKRRIRAIFYENQLTESGFDWVIIVRHKSGLKLDFQSLNKILEKALSKGNSFN